MSRTHPSATFIFVFPISDKPNVGRPLSRQMVTRIASYGSERVASARCPLELARSTYDVPNSRFYLATRPALPEKYRNNGSTFNGSQLRSFSF